MPKRVVAERFSFLRGVATSAAAPSMGVSGTALAGAYAAIGDLDGAFRSLERGLRDRSAELSLMPLQYFLAPLRSDPRFQDIVRRMRPL